MTGGFSMPGPEAVTPMADAPARPPSRASEWWLTAPSLLWLLILFAIPTLIVFAIAFRPADLQGGIGSGWTLDTLRGLANPAYPAILWRTLWMSATATLICLLLAVPTGYAIARAPVRLRHTLLLLVIVPFWTSFLVRIFAWKHILHPEGPVKQFLTFLHLSAPGTPLLYTPGAVLLVMVYTSLPFAILPIFAGAEKFDFQLLEAARDLGCSRGQAFRRIFLPGISRSLVTAFLVTFIPALGSYIIPDVVGGTGGEMLGNKIAQRVFMDRNLPHGAALAALLTLAVLIPPLLRLACRRRDS
jgi:spermidine/putrescine transport system permease protein